MLIVCRVNYAVVGYIAGVVAGTQKRTLQSVFCTQIGNWGIISILANQPISTSILFHLNIYDGDLDFYSSAAWLFGAGVCQVNGFYKNAVAFGVV